MARRTTSRRFQTRGRNAARDATTNPPRRGSLGGRAASARAFPTIACARASLAPPSVADARRALSSTPSGAGAGALYPPQPRPPEPDNDDFELLGELLVRPRPAHQEKGGTDSAEFEARPRFVRKARALIGREQVSGAQVAATEGVQWQRLGRSGRWIARRDERRARGRASGRSRPRLTRPRERRGPANRTRGVERVARVGPGLFYPEAPGLLTSSLKRARRALEARWRRTRSSPPARGRWIERVRARRDGRRRRAGCILRARVPRQPRLEGLRRGLPCNDASVCPATTPALRLAPAHGDLHHGTRPTPRQADGGHRRPAHPGR